MADISISLSLNFSSDNLSDDVLGEIFIRLPFRSTGRCRCVCKRWLRLISNPSFSTEFVSRQHSLFKTYFTLISPHQLMLSFLKPPRLNNNNAQTGLSPNMLINGDVCGYCNGLFLCSSIRYTYGRGYFVYDPFTKECTHIPTCPQVNRWKYSLFAVGFNSNTENSPRRFSVVLINSFADTTHDFRVEVFSSETRRWSHLLVSCENGFAFAPQWLLSFAHREYVCFMGKKNIFVIDPDDTESDFCTIDYPEGVDGMNIVNYGHFGRSGGFLKIADIGQNELRIWELIWKKDDISDATNPYQTWICLYRTNLSQHLPPEFCGNYFKRVAGFHPYDENIVYLHSYIDGVFIVNLRTNKFQHIPGYDKFDISTFQLEFPVPTSYFINDDHYPMIFYRENAATQKIEEIRRCTYLYI